MLAIKTHRTIPTAQEFKTIMLHSVNPEYLSDASFDDEGPQYFQKLK